jgi:hypothetical protein
VTLAALRSSVFADLAAGLPEVVVHEYRRRPGSEQRTKPQLELGVTGTRGEPDRATITVVISLAGADLEDVEGQLDVSTCTGRATRLSGR